MIFILFLLFISLTFFSFFLFDFDYMAPSFIFCAMYTLSIGCSLINYTYWGMGDFSILTASIFLLGAIIFIIASFAVKQAISPHNEINVNINFPEPINVNLRFAFFITILNVVILILWIHGVKSMMGNYGSFGEMMEAYRLSTNYSLNSNVPTMPGYLSQLEKIPLSCGFIFGFIFINNYVNKKIRKVDILLVIANLIIYCAISIYDSNRLNLLGLVAGLTVYYYFLTIGKSQKGNFKIIFKVILTFTILLLVFYGIRLLIGRSDSQDQGFVEYITKYIGGSIKLFDLFIKQPIHNYSTWGFETFQSLNGTLRDLGMPIPKSLMAKEFRTYNGINLGNVYTAYRNWYADFNLRGVIILQFIFALFYNLYYYILRKSRLSRHKIAIIIYGYMSMALFLHPIEDWFYSMFISVGFVTYLIIFPVIYILLTRKIKF